MSWIFSRPSAYGFQHCEPPGGGDPRVLFSLFPLTSYRQMLLNNNAAEVAYHSSITKACCIIDREGVANSGIQGAIGENLEFMPGIIYCASLSAPPISAVIPGNPILGPAQQHIRVRGHQTLREWIVAYPCRMLNNLICHYLAHLPLNPLDLSYNAAALQSWIDNAFWAGFNIFLEATPGTLLSYSISVNFFLEVWSETPINTRIGEEIFLDLATRIKRIIISIIHQRLPAGGAWRGYELFTICLYTAAAYLKSMYNRAPLYPPATDDATIRAYATTWINQFNAAALPQDHNIRLYYFRRQNVLLGENDVGADANHNLNPGCWLGFGQYSRYLTWGQQRTAFSLIGGGEQAGVEARQITLYGIEKMIHRDAHAASTSLLCSEYDRIFFQNAQDRTILMGTNQSYKRAQHIILDPLARPDLGAGGRGKLVRNPTGDNPWSLGLFAGCCWSKFPGARVEAGPFLNYRFFYEPLNEDLNPATYLPVTMPANSVFANYWSYGLDEHLLGRIFRNRIENPGQAEDLRILSYNINWIHNNFGEGGGSEGNDRAHYWRPLAGMLHHLWNGSQALRGFAGGAPRQSFWSDMLVACSNNPAYFNLLGPQITFNTFFGNDGNVGLRLDSMVDPWLTAALPAADGYNEFTTAPRRVACKIQNYNRYDRFDFYNNPALRRVNGAPIALTSFSQDYIGNLIVALQLPMINTECAVGRPNDCKIAAGAAVCPDDAFDALKCSSIPDGLAGGGKRYAKTRRRKLK